MVSTGPNTLALLAAIKRAHPEAFDPTTGNPYLISTTIETYLKDKNEGGFTYTTNMSNVPCGDRRCGRVLRDV